jgi:TPR repeat protein
MTRDPSKLNVHPMNPNLPLIANHDPLDVEAHHDTPSTPLTFPRAVIVSPNDGIGNNASNALRDIEVKADQGDATAQFNYGVMLFQGDGISMNKSLAVHYFKLSADQGHAAAQ